MSNLTVYKASAGSGKTYTLVQEYMQLLLQPAKLDQGEELRDQFKKILVATFTNKATTELRERILEELLEKANHGDAIARSALEVILLDYSSFRVQTIDSFFQEVVRSFVFELNSAKAGAMIELNRDEAIELSVDQLLAKLSPESGEWLTQVMQSELEEGKASDIRKEIARLSKKLLYHQKGPEYDISKIDLDDLANARKELLETKKSSYSAIEEALEELKLTLEPVYEHLDKTSHRFLLLLYDSTVESLMKKVRDKPSATAHHGSINIDDTSKDFLFPKKHDHQAAAALMPLQEKIRANIQSLNKALWEHQPNHYLANLLLGNLNILPLVRGLKEQIEEYQLENNILLIDEVNDLVKTIINESSTPFIYEKVGGRIKHYMIDEFQDTNRTQWENFSHLLDEALSKGHCNYLVGDVKQSIYRWRGTDSNILNSEVESDNRFTSVEVRDLVTNWRSDQNIVTFNNALFNGIYDFSLYCEDAESRADFEAIYQQGVVQQAHHDTGMGYVSFEYLGKPKQTEEMDANSLAMEQMSDKLKDLITKLISDGYQPGDIAFIVRRNKDAAEIAEILTKLAKDNEEERAQYAFISDDALSVNNSTVVRLIVALYRYVAFPDRSEYDLYLRAFVAMHLKKAIHEVTPEVEHLIELALSGSSLIETTYKILAELQVPKSEELYVSSFLDLIYEFSETKVTTYQAFLNWWDKSGSEKHVEMGDDANDRIRIITIHKAKGLQFPIVIIPYLNWNISSNKSQDIEFCKPEHIDSSFPTPDLPFFLIPASITKANLNSKLGSRYREIHEENYLDNLNLLYVACTRPKHRLYIFTDSKRGDNTIAKVVYDRIDNIADEVVKDTKWSFGTETPKLESGKKDAKVSEVTLELNPPQNPDVISSVKQCIPFESKATLDGKLMHDTMARSIVALDFYSAIQRLVLQGSKSQDEASQLIQNFEQMLTNPIVRDWFTLQPNRTILTEQAISLGIDAGIRRPDRVIIDTLEDGTEQATIIDFKFGESQSQRHHKQVRNYIELFNRLGYRSRGFLWYWESSLQITEVSP